jgi:hypothetical protein
VISKSDQDPDSDPHGSALVWLRIRIEIKKLDPDPHLSQWGSTTYVADPNHVDADPDPDTDTIFTLMRIRILASK